MVHAFGENDPAIVPSAIPVSTNSDVHPTDEVVPKSGQGGSAEKQKCEFIVKTSSTANQAGVDQCSSSEFSVLFSRCSPGLPTGSEDC